MFSCYILEIKKPFTVREYLDRLRTRIHSTNAQRKFQFVLYSKINFLFILIVLNCFCDTIYFVY